MPITQVKTTHLLRDALTRSGFLDDVHVDAVADAIATATGSPQARIKAHAVAKWAVQMAAELGAGNEKMIRRCALLREVDAASIEAIPELRECAAIVRCYQNGGIRRPGDWSEDVLLAAGIIEAAERLAIGAAA